MRVVGDGSFDASAWLAGVRATVMPRLTGPAGRPANTLREDLEVFSERVLPGVRRSLISDLRELGYGPRAASAEVDTTHLPVFERAVERLAFATHWARRQDLFAPSLMELLLPRQDQVLALVRTDLVALMEELPLGPGEATAVLRMTVDDYRRFVTEFPEFTPGELQYMARHYADLWTQAGVVRNVAASLIADPELDLTEALARRFAVRNPKDPVEAARKFRADERAVLLAGRGYTRGQASRFAISNRQGPLVAAGRTEMLARKLLDELPELGLTKELATEIAMTRPLRAAEFAREAVAAADELRRSRPDLKLSVQRARKLAIQSPSDLLGAAERYRSMHTPRTSAATTNPPSAEGGTPQASTTARRTESARGTTRSRS